MDETNNNQEHKAGKWAWVVTGVVIVAAAMGFYFWPGRSSEQTPPANTEAENDQDQTMQDQPLSVSDSVSDIETDLNNTSIDNLDKELPDMEAEVVAQ